MGTLLPVHAAGSDDGRVETHMAFQLCERRSETVGMHRGLLWHADREPPGGTVATFGVGIVGAIVGHCFLYV